MITLLVLTDGRVEFLERTIASAETNLVGPITRRVIHDDSADPAYQRWLAGRFMTYEVIHGSRRLGFGGAIARAWSVLRVDESGRFVFHLEDDFTFNRPVDLRAMIDVLDRRPYLAQLALRRQAWNETERFAGGVVEMSPDAYRDVEDGDDHWLEHRLFFTTNPSLYRRELIDRGWPVVAHSEGVFTHQLLRDPDARFGYWGARSDPPWVEHIGAARNGHGY